MKLEWRNMTPAAGGRPISTSLTYNETAQLAALAKGCSVLEIGSAYGYSAVVMALGGASHVYAVDPHVWLASQGTMEQNLADYNLLDKVTIIPTWSSEACTLYAASGRKFDLIWIDGDHEQAAVEQDVRMSLPLLAPGGVLACHDWDEDTCPGVRPGLEATVGKPDVLIDTMAVYLHLAP